MKIKKLSEDTLYKRETIELVFLVGEAQKKVSVQTFSTTDIDEIMDNDGYEINAEDLSKLTDIEHEALGEFMLENLNLEVGEEWDTDN